MIKPFARRLNVRYQKNHYPRFVFIAGRQVGPVLRYCLGSNAIGAADLPATTYFQPSQNEEGPER